MLSPAKILSVEEIQAVLDWLKFDRVIAKKTQLNLVIFRLSACCGLRCKEIQGLELRDFYPNGQFPYIQLRAATTKGRAGKRKSRVIPLWWDWSTFEDLDAWWQWRGGNGDSQEPFVCGLRAGHVGARLTRNTIARHWNRVIKWTLGANRARSLSIHCGRHTFASQCLAAGINPASVRDALGHSSLQVTDYYSHGLDNGVRNVFGKK